MYSITAIEPIINAVGSNDHELLNAVASRFKLEFAKQFGGEPDDEQSSEFRRYAESLITGDPPPDAEPGAWNYVITALAAHFDLQLHQLPLNDWKHYYVWEDYIPLVAEYISPEITALLNFLCMGRPLRGRTLSADGCVFAWLTPAEVTTLHDALTEVEPSAEMEEFHLDDFHDELLDCLEITKKRNACLYLTAH